MLISVAESLERYLDYLSLEKGLSDHSLDSYRNDIEKYGRYLTEKGLNADKMRKIDLVGFLD
jgi:site-specific recombinase XerD